jgi:predicted 3-demethylubiquinone-9 3-methyltransferase (glyoxalase superfamily)
MKIDARIVPCLWFDGRAGEAARFYVDIFPNSRIVRTTHYGAAGREFHGQEPGSVLTVVFELDGQSFTALNGGPLFKFSEALSLQVLCDTQAEVDAYWTKLSAGGDPSAQQCGWLKDKYGLSWQIVPRILTEMLGDPGSKGSERVMAALMGMKKLDIASLKRAHSGA